MRRIVTQRWWLVLGGTLLGVLLLEGAFRWRELAAYRRALSSYTHDVLTLQADCPYLVTLRPNTERHNRVTQRSETFWTYTIGSDGLRTTVRAETAALRVLMLGDSYTFGWGVNDAETFSYVLASRFLQQGLPIQICNAGVPGYGTVQEDAFLQDRADTLRPDLVVLNYVMNDAELQGSVPGDPQQVYRGCPSWLIAHLKRRYRVAWLGFTTPRLYVDSFAFDSWKWRAARKAFGRISTWCHARGVPLLVFILPDVTQSFDASAYPFHLIHRTVVSWGGELGVPTVDLLPPFLGEAHTAYWVPGDGHPNAVAHRKLAELMYPHLLPLVQSRLAAHPARLTKQDPL